MAPNTEIIEALKGYKSQTEELVKGLSDRVDELSKKQTDAANEEIGAIKEQQATLTKSIEDIQNNIKDAQTFGMPGLEDELKSKPFSWTSYLLADYLIRSQKCTREKAWEQADAEYEYEICKQYAAKREKSMQKSIILKAQNSDDGTLGGYLVPPEASSEIIDLTIANMPLMNMPGITRLSGLHGDLFVPKITGRHTGYHVGENTKPTESNATFGGVTFTPKKVGAFTKQSNRLLYQSRGVSDQVIKRLLSEAIALEWHAKLLNGNGSDYQAKGVLQYNAEMTTDRDGSGTALTASNGRFRIDIAAQMQQALDNADELRDTPTYGYLMHPQHKWGMRRERVLQYSGQTESTAQPIEGQNILMNDMRLKDALGYDFKTTTQMPKTGNNAPVIFGDWSLFWIAQFRDPIIRVSDVAGDGSTGSAFLDDQLYIVMFQEYDCKLMRPAAFSYVGDASTAESDW